MFGRRCLDHAFMRYVEDTLSIESTRAFFFFSFSFRIHFWYSERVLSYHPSPDLPPIPTGCPPFRPNPPIVTLDPDLRSSAVGHYPLRSTALTLGRFCSLSPCCAPSKAQFLMTCAGRKGTFNFQIKETIIKSRIQPLFFPPTRGSNCLQLFFYTLSPLTHDYLFDCDMVP